MEHMDNEAQSFIQTQLQGSLSRRTLVKRAAVAGLAVPTVGALVAACGSDDETAEPTETTGAVTETTAAVTESSAEPTETTGAPMSGGTFRLATSKPGSPLDPIAMIDLGTYNVIAQSFEYLTGPEGSGIGPMLATEWTPNADSTVWTFTLREGVTWHDGSPFTAEDVVQTMEKIVAVGDSIGGSIQAGSAVAVDDLTVEITLTGPSASFPYLVSMYNPQAAILPAAWAAGTTLDASPTGTGPWKLDSYDPNTGATFVRNEAWWGGMTPLDSIELQFFVDPAAQVTAMSGDSVDGIQSFAVVGGDALLAKEGFTVAEVQAATHREIWFGCDEGQFTDAKVRQALALTLDRPAIVDALFKGKAAVANDHVIFDLYEFHDPAAVTQRERDVEAAKALLAEAGFEGGLSSTINAVDLGEVPQLAQLMQIQAAEAGFTLDINVESTDTFYGTQWCITYPCAGSAELGIVDYGHRPTPDVYLVKAFKGGGDWNSSQYASADLDAAIVEYQSSAELEARTAACGKIQTIMWNDVPACIPYRYNGLAGYSAAFEGVEFTALGHTLLAKATKVA